MAPLLIAVLFAACSGTGPSGPSNPVATPAPTAAVTPGPPTPAPSPTTLPLTQEELGRAYLACLAPYNAVVKVANETLFKSTTKLKAAKAAFSDLADATGTLDQCIRAIAWTEEYEADVKAKLKSDAATQVTEIQMSKATSWSVLNSYVKDFDKQVAASAAASNLLRGDLGLPPPK